MDDDLVPVSVRRVFEAEDKKYPLVFVDNASRQLTAHDADRTARLVYSLAADEEVSSLGGLLASAEKGVFEVDKEGRVTLQRRLDFEKYSHYRLPVRVSDGEFTADATLHVTVGDVNDEAPRFEINPMQLVADEGAPPGRSIGRAKEMRRTAEAFYLLVDILCCFARPQVRVFDPDSPEVNGVVRCAEPRDLERRQALIFVPDLLTNPSAGVYDLRTRVVLDREGPQVEDGKAFIRLVCWDGNQQSEASRQYGRSPSFTATMTATLTIRDINDNAPVFSRSIYHVETSENNLLGAKIFQVTAHDADSGANSEIIYSLLDHTNFRVDPVSGWITASVEFDREKRDSYQVSALLLYHTTLLFKLIKINPKVRPRRFYEKWASTWRFYPDS
ncbi:unnamed protein product [Schistocephalus solidus]|uniref:Cadherin domain protein n=1 Tax=Schistocephalus solidus TaxID=70667 RepID=A0A183T774_SCHSO|nr:unnamed protein product [Schistocephalus solidus]